MMRAFGPCALVGPSSFAGSRVFAVVWVRVSVFRWGVSGTLYTKYTVGPSCVTRDGGVGAAVAYDR